MTPPASPPPQGPYGQPPQYQPPPAQPYPPGYPQPYPQGYAPPPPKKDNTLLIVVVVVVVLVVFFAAIAAWWFLMVVPTVTNPPTGTKPIIVMTATETANTATILVVAYPAYDRTYFHLNMEVNSTIPASTTPMRQSGVAATVVVNSVTYTITWTDEDASGTLSTNDHFTVSVPTAFLPGTQFHLILVWAADGSVISTCLWST